jgi:hypothetical protein
MPSLWSYPSVVTQYAEVPNHISWREVGDEFTKINLITTVSDLKHISNTAVNDIKMKTYYLVLTGFEWEDLPETISGIEAQINIRRVGRITDDTVSLYLNQGIGENKANADLANNKTYGGETDLWGLEEITPEMLTDLNFGMVLRYQSHPSWPHSSSPIMHHVQLRAW